MRSKLLFFLNKLLIIFDKGYQDSHTPKTLDQFELIFPVIQDTKFKRNILEVGTNKGNLIKLFSNHQFMVFGIDKLNHHRNLSNILVGELDITEVDMTDFPEFSNLFILSVHHQFISMYGELYTLDLLNRLSQIIKSRIFIEFAALNSKYGFSDGDLFIDNDSDTILEYGFIFLSRLNKKCTIKFLGKTREDNPNEPFRYLFEVCFDC